MFTPKKLNIAILTLLTSSGAMANSQLLPIAVTADAISQNTLSMPQLLENTGNTEGGAVLRQFSGVEAQRLGGIGLDVLIRGQGQSAVNILVDGGKIEGGCPNRMDPPTHYTELSSFDRITVLKGVQSLQYGVGGTAGTVLLERDQPEFDADKAYQGDVYAATNSNGLTRDIGAQVAVGNEQMYMVLQGSSKSADDYQDGNGKDVRSSYETTQGHIDLGWTPSQDHHVKLSHEISNTQDALYQGSSMDAPQSDGSMTRLSYEGKNFSGPVNAIDVSAYQSSVEHVMNNFSLRPQTGTFMETPTEVTTQGAKIKLTSNLNQTRLDYGLMLQTVEKQATLFNRSVANVAQFNKSQYLMWPNTSTEQNSVFVEANTALSSTQNLIYGVRVDSVTAEAKDAHVAPDNTMMQPQPRKPVDLYNAAYSNYTGNTKIEETNWNGLIRYEQTLSSSLAWFGGLSLTTRTADETERFMARNTWTGNPDLNPEKHLQLDLGINQQTHAFNWSANVFYDRVTDYILRDMQKNQTSLTNMMPVGMPPNTSGINNIYVNVDAVIFGAELDWGYQLNQAWSFGGNLALTRGRNTTDDRNLSNMAPLNGLINARYDQAQWYAGADLNFAIEQSNNNEL